MDKLGNIFHVNFLGYAQWVMFIIIPQIKCYYISMDQARYGTSVVEKYLGTATIKENSKFHKTTLPNDMIFTKEYSSTSY